MTNENKILVGSGGVAVLILAFMYWKKKKAANDIVDGPAEVDEVKTATVTKPKKGATLDRNKLLKVGSKGLEVRELQRLLGVNIDGAFGAKETLAALQNEKGVIAVSLNSFANLVKKKVTNSIPKVLPKTLPKVLPKKGQKLMSIQENTKIMLSKYNANKTIYNTGSTFRTVDYGDEAGEFVSVANKGQYLIKYLGIFVFVDGNSVKPY